LTVISQLIETLRRQGDQICLRVVEAPGARVVHEFTGAQLLRAQDFARRQEIADDARVVLLLLPHSPELFLLQIGLTLIGKTPAVLPWPTTRVDAFKYQRNLLQQLNQLPADHLITLPQLAKNVAPGVAFPITGCELAASRLFESMFLERFAVEADRKPRAAHRQTLPDDALFLQFSGGTTGTQKCVVVTSAMLSAQIQSLSQALKQNDDDGVVSWLPLYHDMGLIACLYFPLLRGIPSLHLSASDWLMRPEQLFEYIERYHATFCWLPNFAFSYLAQRREMMEGRCGLGHMRAWINCSEPIRHKSIDDFAECFGDWGVDRAAMQASYAMAENVFAVTQSTIGAPLSLVKRSKVQGAALASSDDAFELSDDVYVSSGRCLDRMNIRIVARDGSTCPDLVAGEIQLRTSCLFDGYWDRAGFRRDVFTAEGWYLTGDFGFLSDGQLFVIGRMKDIIIVAGQNIFPEDIETLTSQIEGVYPGRVVAFGVENEELGTQAIGIVAEVRGEFDPAIADRIEKEIRSQISASLGVAPRYVSVVPQRWIIKSTAGKISRGDTRDRFLREQQLAVVGG
jgi:acyl-CoA synthetase (AMP-forming)/AMP-acid ligase II